MNLMVNLMPNGLLDGLMGVNMPSNGLLDGLMGVGEE